MSLFKLKYTVYLPIYPWRKIWIFRSTNSKFITNVGKYCPNDAESEISCRDENSTQSRLNCQPWSKRRASSPHPSDSLRPHKYLLRYKNFALAPTGLTACSVYWTVPTCTLSEFSYKITGFALTLKYAIIWTDQTVLLKDALHLTILIKFFETL